LPVRERYEAQDTGSEQRECARREWCRKYTLKTADGQTSRRGALGYRAFCELDEAGIGAALGDLPGYYVYLGAELGMPATDGQHLHVPAGPRLPIRPDIDALMRLITETLCSWEERVRAAARLTTLDTQLSRHRRSGKAVLQASRVLSAHLGVLLALAAEPMTRLSDGMVATEDLSGADAGLEILHLKYRARSALGETRPKPEELLGVLCRRKSCDLRALYRADPPQHDGAAAYWSVCAACGDRMTEAQYRTWTRRCAAYEQASTRHVPVLENLPSVADVGAVTVDV
jgi:hypothetical protein